MRIYAIGDIHGQLSMLRSAHARIAEDRKNCGDTTAQVIHLGDYVDRGHDSRSVIDFLLEGKRRGEPWRFLLGNHDRMFRMFLENPNIQDPVLKKEYTWLHERLGGRDTLESYQFDGVRNAAPDLLWAQCGRVPQSHMTFLNGLEICIETDSLFFAHAGIRPGVPIADQSEDDLIWIRTPFHIEVSDHGKLVVHGHTPVEEPAHYGNRINLDTGAGYWRPITAAVFEDTKCWILTDAGREPLVPPNAANLF